VASTLTVQNSVTYCSTLIKNQRMNINNYEPGLTAARDILQLMLAPPFVWRFNRTNFSIDITEAGGTDYVVTLNDLGSIEQQWLDDGKDTADSIIGLGGQVQIQKSSGVRQPKQVAPVYDDNNGLITFRFDSIPDQDYTAYFDYQRKAPLISGWSQGFGPVPDEFAFIFNKWMLSEAALIVNDARFEIWRREAIAGLLATQDGLDAQAKDMFYAQMMNVGRTNFRSQSLGQSGAKARES
jgi:hypothetical protein